MTDQDLGYQFANALRLALDLNERRRLQELHADAARRGQAATTAMFPHQDPLEIDELAARVGAIVRELGLGK